MEKLSRWPLLLGALALSVTGVGVDLTSDAARGLAAVLLVLAAVCLGGFVYAEGARHREWLDRQDDDAAE